MRVTRRTFGQALGGAFASVAGCSPGPREHPGVADAGPEEPATEAALECPVGPAPARVQTELPLAAIRAYIGGRGAFRETTLCEYYDPDGSRGIHALMVVASAVWCGPCNEYAPFLEAHVGPYLARGARVIELLFEDGLKTPPTQATVDLWIERLGTTFDTGIGLKLSDFFAPGRENFPSSFIVNPRTMQLRAVRGGFDPDPAVAFKALDQVLVANGR